MKPISVWVLFLLTEKKMNLCRKKKLGLVGFVETWHICISGSLAVTFCISKVEFL